VPGCCDDDGHEFDGLSADYRRRLLVVIALNAAMFMVEIAAGQFSGSKALQADALDFLGDAATYSLTLAVIGAAARTRALAALVKGASLSAMGMWILASTLHRAMAHTVPQAEVMGLVGFCALAVNVTSVIILMRYKDGEANVRSVWLCSRNDAIGNIAVMVAALGVWGTRTAWPDLIVAAVMAGLFLNSSLQIIAQSRRELRQAG